MLTDTRASNMAEYALIAALVLAVAYVVFQKFGKNVNGAVDKANGAFN